MSRLLRHLSTLQDYPAGDSTGFESTLASVLDQLLELLRHTQNVHHLQLSHDGHSVNLLYYTKNTSPAPISKESIASLGNGPTDADLDLVVAELLSYDTPMAAKLSDLITFFNSFYVESERSLVSFLSSCFTGGADFLSEAEIAERLQRLHIDESPDVQLSCNDPNVLWLYLMLQQVPQASLTTKARSLVSMFKKHNGCTVLEVDDFASKETKMNHFYSFFLDGLFPAYYTDSIEKVLEEIPLFPQNTQSTFLTRSKREQHDIFLNLRHIIPLLNEFSFDFSPSFPLLFKHYLFLVYNKFSEASEKADFEFIERIVSHVNVIVRLENNDASYAANLDLKLTVAAFYHDHMLLADPNQPTLVMRLAGYEIQSNTSLKKVILTDWNIKMLTVGQLEYNLSHKFMPSTQANSQRRILKLWFNKFKRYQNLQKVSEDYHCKALQAQILRKNWIPKLIAIGESHMTANKRVLSRYMFVWIKKQRLVRTMTERAEAHDTAMILDSAISRWTESYRKVENLLSIAEERRIYNLKEEDAKTKEIVLSSWKEKCSPATYAKFRDLSRIERMFTLRKSFACWKKRHLNRLSLHEFQKNSNAQLVYYVFAQWMKNYTVNMRAYTIELTKNHKIRSRTFQYWVECVQQRTTADRIYEKNLVSKMFQKWKLENRAKFHLPQIQLLQLRKWRLALRKRKIESVRNGRLCHNIILRWRDKLTKTQQDSALAVQVQEETQLSSVFSIWKQKLRNLDKLDEVADLNFQRRFLDKMISLHHHYTVAFNAAATEFPQGVDLNTKITLKYALSQWKQQYSTRFELSAQRKVEYFQQNISDPNLRYTTLVKWVDKYNQILGRKSKLEARCSKFLATSQLKRSIFKRWHEKCSQVQQIKVTGRKFELNLLYKKFILIWYDQYVNKALYLNEIVEEKLSQKEFETARDILSKWSMKRIKIQRNIQTSTLFAERWQLAKARSIVELWVQKTREKTGDDPDTSVSISPLANKSRPQSRDASYLYTPVKKQIQRSPSTPTGKGPSPSKLQETNIKMKNERIESLRRHFSKAKGQSTPRRNELRAKLNQELSPVRLSPPKIRPLVPPAPNFMVPERPSSSSSEASTIEPGFSENSSTTQIDYDESVIESAKRLRKITPIYIPTEDEPRFTPISKLRQLRDRDVFGQ